MPGIATNAAIWSLAISRDKWKGSPLSPPRRGGIACRQITVAGMDRAQDQQLTRFRATWGSGEDYRAGDVVARGRKSYQALCNHTAGAMSEPMHGDDWTSFWEVWPDDASEGRNARAVPLTVIQTAPPAAIAAPIPRPADASRLSVDHTPPRD
jgi:hypothetical protein